MSRGYTDIMKERKSETVTTTGIRKTTMENLREYRAGMKLPPSAVDLVSVAVDEYIERHPVPA